jgi:hypothetical protein
MGTEEERENIIIKRQEDLIKKLLEDLYGGLDFYSGNYAKQEVIEQIRNKIHEQNIKDEVDYFENEEIIKKIIEEIIKNDQRKGEQSKAF